MSVTVCRPTRRWSRSGFDESFPSSLRYHAGDELQWCQPGDTAYLFVMEGPVELSNSGRGRFTLQAGMFASIPDSGFLVGGKAVIFERHGYRGVFAIGGPIEKTGRLRYIDGCTDSLLLPPSRRGDPCLNHLHFPVGIDQTAHTHPSCRLGVVYRGRGECETHDAILPLEAGTLFAMTPDSIHKFRTTDSTMDVIAYHPDSDTGPDDDDHPMIRRTIVDGVAAHLIPEIRTSYEQTTLGSRSEKTDCRQRDVRPHLA